MTVTRKTVEIKRGEKIPPLPKRGPPYKYPFGQMRVGDMLIVEGVRQAAHSCVKAFTSRYQPKWTFRLEEFILTDGVTRHTKVWRLS